MAKGMEGGKIAVRGKGKGCTTSETTARERAWTAVFIKIYTNKFLLLT